MQLSSYPGRCLNCTLQGLGICNDVFWSFPPLLICQRTTDITEYCMLMATHQECSPHLNPSIHWPVASIVLTMWALVHSGSLLMSVVVHCCVYHSQQNTSPSNSLSALCPVTSSYTVNRTVSFPLRRFRSFDVYSETLHVLSVSSCECLYLCWGSSTVCACTAGLRGCLTQRKWLMTGLTELCMCSFCQWHQDDHNIAGQHSYPCFKETVCLWCLYCIPPMIV